MIYGSKKIEILKLTLMLYNKNILFNKTYYIRRIIRLVANVAYF